MLNNCFAQSKIPTIWRKLKIIAIIKPGKDSAIPKIYRPISLLCHTYKLYERLILNRIAPAIEEHLIKDQAGFRHGKSCTSQLLNLTQHNRRWLPGRKYFMVLSAAYDVGNHSPLIQKINNATQDSKLCRVIQNLLSNRKLYVELNNVRSRWRKQKNDLTRGSELVASLFNIYTNYHPIHNGTRSFIYADDLCITTQYQAVPSMLKRQLKRHWITCNILQNEQSACKSIKNTSLHLISGIKRPKDR